VAGQSQLQEAIKMTLTQATKLYAEGRLVTKAYLGTQLIWEAS